MLEHKRRDMTKIKCPVIISGFGLSSIHTIGAVRGWMELLYDKKWIRRRSFQEWHELHCVKSVVEELHKYFDRFLNFIEKARENDTLEVRWSAIQFGDCEAIDNIEHPDFSVPGTENREIFLADRTISAKASEQVKSVTYLHTTSKILRTL